MNHLLIRLCLALCPLLSFVDSSMATPADNTELQIFKAQTEAKIEAAKDSQQKDLQLYQQLATSQNERIEQINHQVDWLGHLIGLGSLIITLLLVVIGYFAYGKAKSDAENIAKTVARDEANSTSKAEVKKWFDDNLAFVHKEINALKDTLQQTTKEVDTHAAHVHQKIDQADADLQAHANQIIANNPVSTDAKSTLTATDKQTLVAADSNLQDKPEAQYTFDDWNIRAFAASAESNLTLAAEYWKKASRATGATDDQVSLALYNQGVALGQQNKPDEAIACYQQVVQRFGDSTLPSVQERVAKALNNQGSALGWQNKPDEALACFHKIFQRVGDASQPALQEQMAIALNGLGFAQILKAKRAWDNQAVRTELLSESFSLFEQAKEKMQSNEVKALVLGNVSYTLWLQGKEIEVEAPLREALTLGGKEIFKAEIEDTKISSVPPDSGFEQLVTRLWNEIAALKGTASH